MAETHDIVLEGCSPVPLASYLKALGVLRLVSEQVDENARGAWSSSGFVLTSRLETAELIRFFADEYRPTPILSPWNGGSGFHPNDTRAGIDAIVADRSPRLSAYRDSIIACRGALDVLRIPEKPDKNQKALLVALLRSELPDAALRWLDAAIVLSDDGAKFPPLLGTGGNDGRLDFSNNQMQRIAELFGGVPDRSRSLLGASLFGSVVFGLDKGNAVGQFAPSAAGGANATAGFDRAALLNPWDYILLLEGALIFAAAVTRKDESSTGTLAFPFMVRSAGAGYGSAARADEDDTRDEIWLPLWERAASLREIERIFSEGRAKLPGASVRSGIDFARAIVSFGVDRGLTAFERYAFHARNGLSYLATPLGRFEAARRTQIDLLADLDRGAWLDRLRRAAGDARAPAALRRAGRKLDESVLALARGEGPSLVADVLVALGEVEAVCGRSQKARERVPPIPPLRREWATASDDGSVEHRLACALAPAGLRDSFAPIDQARPWQWAAGRELTWTRAGLVGNLVDVLTVRERTECATPIARQPARLDDLASFVNGAVDDHRIEELLRGLVAVTWDRSVASSPRTRAREPAPLPAALALLSLALHGPVHLQTTWPRTPGMISRLAAGDLPAATRLALRRLRGSGLAPRVSPIVVTNERARRIAAALIFPLADLDRGVLARLVLGQNTEEDAIHDHAP